MAPGPAVAVAEPRRPWRPPLMPPPRSTRYEVSSPTNALSVSFPLSRHRAPVRSVPLRSPRDSTSRREVPRWRRRSSAIRLRIGRSLERVGSMQCLPVPKVLPGRPRQTDAPTPYTPSCQVLPQVRPSRQDSPPQRSARLEETAADARGADPNQSRHLFCGQALQLDEIEHLALTIRQFTKERREQPCELAPDKSLRRIASDGRNRFEQRVESTDVPLPSLPPQSVRRRVARDRVEPRSERLTGWPALDVSNHADHHLLHHVIGVRSMCKSNEGPSPDSWRCNRYQLLQCRITAAARSICQLAKTRRSGNSRIAGLDFAPIAIAQTRFQVSRLR